MEYEVPHDQEAMTDEEMVRKNPYSANKYPTQSKKRNQTSSQKESDKKRKGAKANIPLQDIDTNDLLSCISSLNNLKIHEISNILNI